LGSNWLTKSGKKIDKKKTKLKIGPKVKKKEKKLLHSYTSCLDSQSIKKCLPSYTSCLDSQFVKTVKLGLNQRMQIIMTIKNMHVNLLVKNTAAGL